MSCNSNSNLIALIIYNHSDSAEIISSGDSKLMLNTTDLSLTYAPHEGEAMQCFSVTFSDTSRNFIKSSSVTIRFSKFSDKYLL